VEIGSRVPVLGRKVSEAQKELDTFQNPGVRQVTLATDELTCNCPVTGQPDFYSLQVEYGPKDYCIESKSFKLYVWSFRSEGHFCEVLTSTILADIVEAVQPEWCRVELCQTVRGGISITACATYGQRE